jgi:hypothetical protein
MTPTDTNLGFVETIESLRIPIITEAHQNKQCFYLSHDERSITLCFPKSDGETCGVIFPKLASGENIEEQLLYDLIHKTKSGKKLHQDRIDDVYKQMQRLREETDDSWVKGFSAGANDARMTFSLRWGRDVTLATIFGLIIGALAAASI